MQTRYCKGFEANQYSQDSPTTLSMQKCYLYLTSCIMLIFLYMLRLVAHYQKSNDCQTIINKYTRAIWPKKWVLRTDCDNQVSINHVTWSYDESQLIVFWEIINGIVIYKKVKFESLNVHFCIGHVHYKFPKHQWCGAKFWTRGAENITSETTPLKGRAH